MKGKVIKLTKRFATRTLMATVVLAASNTIVSAQSYSVGQQVVINENNNYFLGKITENAGSFYWVETQAPPTQVEKGIAPASIMTVDDAKKKNISYKDLNAGTTSTSTLPKIDIPNPPAQPQAPATTRHLQVIRKA